MVNGIPNKTKSKIEYNTKDNTNEYIKKLPKYITKYKFKPQKVNILKIQENDLSLDIGDEVYIEDKRKNGWWVGIANGKRGYVPSNYLETYEKENCNI